MAVRFDADSEDYTRTLGLGTVTQFSLSCWVKISTDRDTYSTAWCIDSGANTDYSYLQTTNDGTSMGFYQDGASVIGARALTVGSWYWWGVAVNGANITVMSRALSDTAPVVSTSAAGSANTNGATLRLGESVFGGEWLNGCLAAVKLWNGATLTQAELDAEAFKYLPARTTNLYAWYPLIAPEPVDYSGASRTLSGGSGTTVEDGPPIPWGPRRHAIYLPSGTAVALTDTAAVTDQLTVTADTPLAETAAVTDALTTVTVDVALSDSIGVVDDLTVNAALTLADDFSVSDAIAAGSPIDLADSLAIADALTVDITPMLDDQVAVADDLTATAAVPLADIVAIADALTVAEILPKTLADTIGVDDSLSVAVFVDITVSSDGPIRRWGAGRAGREWTGTEERRWGGGPPTT